MISGIVIDKKFTGRRLGVGVDLIFTPQRGFVGLAVFLPFFSFRIGIRVIPNHVGAIFDDVIERVKRNKKAYEEYLEESHQGSVDVIHEESESTVKKENFEKEMKEKYGEDVFEQIKTGNTEVLQKIAIDMYEKTTGEEKNNK